MTEIDSITVDTSEMEAALLQLEQHAAITGKTVTNVARKGYRTIALLADIIGRALPLWFSLMAEAAFMAATMFSELAAAETMTGWMAAKAMVTFSIAALMFYRGLEIQAQKSEVETDLNSIMHIANLWS